MAVGAEVVDRSHSGHNQAASTGRESRSRQRAALGGRSAGTGTRGCKNPCAGRSISGRTAKDGGSLSRSSRDAACRVSATAFSLFVRTQSKTQGPSTPVFRAKNARKISAQGDAVLVLPTVTRKPLYNEGSEQRKR